MSANPSCAWLNGSLVPWRDAVIPVEDRGLQFGESLYEVLPVTAGRVRLVTSHCARLARGAAALGLTDWGIPDGPGVERIAASLIAEEGVSEGLLNLQLTGGTAARAHIAAGPATPTSIAYLRRHRFPTADEVHRGIRAVTVGDTRWARCDLKTTMLLPAVLAKRQAAARGADEALFVGVGGTVHEGASSSIFAVVGDRLLSPRDGSHQLRGTMQELVVHLASRLRLQVAAADLTVDDLVRADEVFVTATSRLVMPVVAIDDRPVAGGGAGVVAVDLAAAVREHLELG